MLILQLLEPIQLPMMLVMLSGNAADSVTRTVNVVDTTATGNYLTRRHYSYH